MKTAFQEMVYKKIEHVVGKVTTYSELANALRCGSPQAIGQARNPYAPKIPCHRVVDGKIGGFNGKKTGTNIRKKISILKSEGVTVKEGEVLDFDVRLHKFS